MHIKECDLITILQEVLLRKGILLDRDIRDIAKDLINKGKSYSASSRSVRVTNDKLEKKVIKMKLAGRSDTAVFAYTLLLVRQQMKHRGLRLIRVGDQDWLNIKEICKLATDFCNEFSLEIKEGYRQYLTLGMRKMKNFSIYKFKSLHASICNEYEAIQEIERDPTPQKTGECHDIYLANIAEKTGITQGYKDFPEKYQYFIKAKEEARKYGVSIRHYIAAQFFGFEWNNSIPDPTQLVGAKSVDRLQKYAYAHNIKLGNNRTLIDYKHIKSLRHGGDRSKQQQK